MPSNLDTLLARSAELVPNLLTGRFASTNCTAGSGIRGKQTLRHSWAKWGHHTFSRREGSTLGRG